MEVELEAMALFSLPFHKDYHSAAGVLARWFEEFASHVSHFWGVLIFLCEFKREYNVSKLNYKLKISQNFLNKLTNTFHPS